MSRRLMLLLFVMTAIPLSSSAQVPTRPPVRPGSTPKQEAPAEPEAPALEPIHWIVAPGFGAGRWNDENVAISPNAGFLVERAAMGLRVWKLADNTLAHTLNAPPGWEVKRPAFASEREIVVVNNKSRKIGILDVFTGKTRQVVDMGMERVFTVQTGGDTLLVEGSRAEIWRLSTMKRLATLVEDNWPVYSGRPLAEHNVSHDGSVVYTCQQIKGGDQIAFYETRTGKRMGFTLTTHTRHKVFADISPDGTLFAHWENALHVHNVRTGAKLGTLELEPKTASLEFDRSSNRLIVKQGKHVAVVDAETREVLVRRETEDHWAMLSWGPGGIDLIGSRGNGGVTRLSYPELTPKQIEDARAVTTAVALTPDGKTLFTGEQDGRVKRWSLADADKPVAEFKLSAKPKYAGMEALILSGDGESILLMMRSGESAVLDAATLKPQREFQADADTHPEATGDLKTLVAHERNERLVILDGQTGKTRHVIEHGMRVPGPKRLSADGRHVLVGDESRLVAYAMETGKQAYRIDMPAYDIFILPSDPPLALAASRSSRHFFVFDTRDGKVLLRADEKTVRSCRLTALLAAMRNTDPRSQAAVLALAPAASAAASQLGVSGSRLDLCLPGSRAPAAVLVGYSGDVNDWSQTPDGRHVAIAAGDGSVAVFDLMEHLRHDLTLPRDDAALAAQIEQAPTAQVLRWTAALAAAPARIVSLEKWLAKHREPLERAERNVAELSDPSKRKSAATRLSRAGDPARAAVAAALLAEPAADEAEALHSVALSLRLDDKESKLRDALKPDMNPYARAYSVLTVAKAWAK